MNTLTDTQWQCWQNTSDDWKHRFVSQGLAIDDIHASQELVTKPLLDFIESKKELDLSFEKLDNIEPLALLELQKLDLSGNNLSDITPLKDMTTLTELDLGHNKITDLTALEGLTCLTSLNLEHNLIKDIKPLTDLYQLRVLRLNNNKLTDIDTVGYLEDLWELYVQNNKILDFTVLTECSLSYADVSNNDADLEHMQWVYEEAGYEIEV